MTTRRHYDQFCGLAAGLDVVGERWTLLVIRELLPGPVRFNDILAALPGMGPNLLSARLKTLAEAGVVVQRSTDADGRGREYLLTGLGESLREPVLALARWGLGMIGSVPETATVRSSWGFLAVQAMIQGAHVPDVREDYEFRVGDEVFHIRLAGSRAEAVRGAAPEPAMVATTDARTFVEIGASLITPFAAVVSGRLTITGDPEAVVRCTELMGLTVATAA